MTSDPDLFEEGPQSRERAFRPKPIRIATAARNIRCGLPDMKASPARRRPTKSEDN